MAREDHRCAGGRAVAVPPHGRHRSRLRRPRAPGRADPRPARSRSRELVELYLERIARLDPTLNGYRVVFAERALAEADQADGRARRRRHAAAARRPDRDQGRHRRRRARSPRCGSDAVDRARRPPTPRSCGGCARRARSSSARRNVPELMATPFTESPTFGVTRNPWDLAPHAAAARAAARRAAVAAGLVRGRARLRRRRLDPHPGRLLRPVRPQAAARPRADRAATSSRWHGMAIWGPLTRTVADAARFYGRRSATAARSFAEAARASPGALRIASRTGAPARHRRARRRRAARRRRRAPPTLLRELGHEVAERDARLRARRWATACSRATCAASHDEAREHRPHPERLSRRTRGFARIGRS